MPKLKTPNQKRKYSELNARLAKYVALVEKIYEQLNLEAAKLVSNNTDYDANADKPFLWSDYPQTRKKINDIRKQFVEDIQAVIQRGTSEEWKNSNEVQDLLANAVLMAYDAQVDGEKYKVFYQENSDALKAFQERKDRGMNISDKLWNQSSVYKQELEEAISCAIRKGTSAITLSKQISKYLQDFPKLQKDYKELFGKSSRAKDCEYRSIRLARSEINMAYRQAENLRWQQMDFVVGYEIKLSGNHTCNGKPFHDICDELKGKYPKTFQWNGWHPLCYSDDSEILTNRGWKLFKDVLDGDLILSLNPSDRTVEWVEFTDRQCYWHEGDMVHFFNKSLDCLVTPEHQMVYVNKSNGKLKKCSALEYTKGKGGFYRGCRYEGEDADVISIGKTELKFDLFCEFMGYWLSDGSTIRKSQIVISQQDGEATKPAVISCISAMGFKPSCNHNTISFYYTSLCQYLKQFGKCFTKYVPEQIKNASKRQIRIFLDAFALCDGHKRPFKSFTGNHGNEFKSDKDEILYFTTSERMAGDLSELILKSGHRPSFYVNRAGMAHKNNGHTIKSNYACYVIRECYSVTATVFDKEVQGYNGFVYDLTLEKNHIMYICRNGKCFWGSNCRCYKISILKTEEEFWAWDGRGEPTTESVNKVKDVPDNFKQWVGTNSQRIADAKKRDTLPYFIRDNQNTVNGILKKTPVKKYYMPASVNADVRKLWVDNAVAIEKKLGITQGKPMTFDETNELRGNINYVPKYIAGKDGRLTGNPSYTDADKKYSVNCQSCVVANELRRRGYDVTALPNLKTKWDIPYELSLKTEWAWIDPNTSKAPKKTVVGRNVDSRGRIIAKPYKEVMHDLMIAMDEPGRYHVNFAWKNSNDGHIVTFERLNNGKIVWYDPQTGEKDFFNQKYYGRIKVSSGIHVLRVDNLLINDEIIEGIVEQLKK